MKKLLLMLMMCVLLSSFASAITLPTTDPSYPGTFEDYYLVVWNSTTAQKGTHIPNAGTCTNTTISGQGFINGNTCIISYRGNQSLPDATGNYTFLLQTRTQGTKSMNFVNTDNWITNFAFRLTTSTTQWGFPNNNNYAGSYVTNRIYRVFMVYDTDNNKGSTYVVDTTNNTLMYSHENENFITNNEGSSESSSVTWYSGDSPNLAQMNKILLWKGNPEDAPYSLSGDITYEPPTPPDGGANNTQVTINVSCDPSSNNVSLWFDNSTDPTTLVINNQVSPSDYLTSVTLEDTYYYKSSCDGGVTNGTVRSWIYDISSPIISTTYVNNSRYYSNNLQGVFNFSDNVQLNSVNFSIDGETVFVNESIGSPTFGYVLNEDISSLSKGAHTLSVRVADSHTAQELKTDYGVSNGLLNNYIRYDFPKSDYIKTELKTKSAFDSWSSERKRDRYTQILEPNNPTSTLVLVETSNTPIKIVNSRGHYKGQWIIIGDHWKDYVVKNEPQSKVSIKRLTPYSVEVTISGLKNPSRVEFESVGDLNIVTNEYTFYTVNVSETYDSLIFNGFNADYSLSFFNDFTPLPNVILHLDGTNYSVPLEYQNVNEAKFSTSVLFNESLSSSRLVYHNWLFNLTNESYESTSNVSQTLLEIGLQVCDATNFTYPVLNMSYRDDISESLITATNTYELDFNDGTSVEEVDGVFSGSTSDSICTNVDPTNVTYSWDVSGRILSLESPGYATRLFEFSSGVPFATSNVNPYQLDLSLILLNESTTVNYIWQTDSFQPINGIMRVYECAANGSTTLIESTPIIDSNAHANIELLNTPYSYDVIIEGEVFTDLDGFTKCHLESLTSINYFVDVGDIDVPEKLGLYLTECSLEETGNRTFKFSWGNNPEDTVSPITGCITTYRSSVLGLQEVYTNCTSSSNSIERTIPETGFDYIVRGEITQDDFTVVCGGELSVMSEVEGASKFGLEALIAVVFLVLGLALFYAGEGEFQLIAAMIAVIVSWTFGLLNFDFMIVSSIIGFLIMIVMIGRYTRKR